MFQSVALLRRQSVQDLIELGKPCLLTEDMWKITKFQRAYKVLSSRF